MGKKSAEEERKEWFESYVAKLDTRLADPKTTNGSHRCPCCAKLTLSERAGFEICPVCFWEDDGQDDMNGDEVRGGPNGRLSLRQARENYHRIGACEERALPDVRPPRADEE